MSHDELRQFLAVQEDGLPDDTLDVDELIHKEENEDQPPAMPPDSMEDFEKAIQGEEVQRRVPRIPPANPD